MAQGRVFRESILCINLTLRTFLLLLSTINNRPFPFSDNSWSASADLGPNKLLDFGSNNHIQCWDSGHDASFGAVGYRGGMAQCALGVSAGGAKWRCQVGSTIASTIWVPAITQPPPLLSTRICKRMENGKQFLLKCQPQSLHQTSASKSLNEI